jgi:hypothetical protein
MIKDTKISKICNDIIREISIASSGITDTNFTNAMAQFITNIYNIKLNTIDDFIPCDKKLYLTRPKMREEMRKYLKGRMHHFFKERNYENYEEINGCNLYQFEENIEIAVKILAKKQQGKIAF